MTIKSRLGVALCAGALGLSPALALADDWSEPTGREATNVVPDHAMAESHGPEAPSATVPDHNAAEPSTSRDAMRPSGLDLVKGVPDQATAEARGVPESER